MEEQELSDYEKDLTTADERIREAKGIYNSTLYQLRDLVDKQVDGAGPDPRVFATQLGNKVDDLTAARRRVLGALQRRSTVECSPWQ